MVLTVQPGSYQYRVIIDGKWQEDPANPTRVPNHHGGSNSLLRVIPCSARNAHIAQSIPAPTTPMIRPLAAGRAAGPAAGGGGAGARGGGGGGPRGRAREPGERVA